MDRFRKPDRLFVCGRENTTVVWPKAVRLPDRSAGGGGTSASVGSVGSVGSVEAWWPWSDIIRAQLPDYRLWQ